VPFSPSSSWQPVVKMEISPQLAELATMHVNDSNELRMYYIWAVVPATQDDAEAVKSYHEAAEGHARAQHNLGLRYA